MASGNNSFAAVAAAAVASGGPCNRSTRACNRRAAACCNCWCSSCGAEAGVIFSDKGKSAVYKQPRFCRKKSIGRTGSYMNGMLLNQTYVTCRKRATINLCTIYIDIYDAYSHKKKSFSRALSISNAALASLPAAFALQFSSPTKAFLLHSPRGRSLDREHDGESRRADVRH